MPDTAVSRLRALCIGSGLEPGPDGVHIRSTAPSSTAQEAERKVRERDASLEYGDYLAYVPTLYSIPVMDHELRRFLRSMPENATVLDIGGGFGWHWRNVRDERPDIAVAIVDFVKENLVHARKLLGSLVGDRVALIHGDGTALPFVTAETGSGWFNGVWTVQTFQHIPDFEGACREACRVLRPGGRFVNYSMQATPLVHAIYRLLRRHYHLAGMTKPGPGQMYFDRVNDAQSEIVARVFGGSVRSRYTECLFHTEFRLTSSGRRGSRLGLLDAHLGDYPAIGRWIGRQRSLEVVKPVIADAFRGSRV